MDRDDLRAARSTVIMAADVAGYSRLVATDAEGTVAALKRHRAEFIDPLIAAEGGRIANTAGDSLLVEFDDLSRAVACCMALQRGMGERNADTPATKRVDFRIGLHVGSVIASGGDMLGGDVNLAARIEGTAEPGGLSISDRAFEALAQGREDFQDTGSHRLKNIPLPVRIWRWTGEGSADRAVPSRQAHRVVAVLPFENRSSDPDQTHFADGLSEDIILLLSKVSSLGVISRNTTFGLAPDEKDARHLARAFGVTHAVSGSVRKAGNRVRIHAQLVDAATAEALWSERYDRELADVFDIQDEVTAQIAEALSLRLTRQEKTLLAKDRAVDLAAYDLFHRGRELMYRTNRTDNIECRRVLTDALAIQPDFAKALSYLSMTYVMDHVNAWTDAPDNLVRAEALAGEAVARDDTEALAHLAVSTVALWMRNHDLAIDASATATRFDPNYAHAFFHYGSALTYGGRPGEALPHFEIAKMLDPRHADVFLHWNALAYFHIRDFARAADMLRRRLTRNPDSDVSRVLLASCLGFEGLPEEAREEWARVLRINPRFSFAQKRAVLPYRSPEDFGMIEEGLRLAGIDAEG